MSRWHGDDSSESSLPEEVSPLMAEGQEALKPSAPSGWDRLSLLERRGFVDIWELQKFSLLSSIDDDETEVILSAIRALPEVRELRHRVPHPAHRKEVIGISTSR